MDEQDLIERLTGIADAAPVSAAAPADDVRRGQRRRRRRIWAGAGASALTTAAVVAAAVAIAPSVGGSAHGSQPLQFSGRGTERGATAHPPRHSTASPQLPTPGTRHLIIVKTGAMVGRDDQGTDLAQQEFNQALYAATLTALDPTSQYLDHDANPDWTGGIGAANGALTSLGMKLGWKGPDDSGEGMVMVVVAEGPAVAQKCGDWAGKTCHAVTLPDGGTAEVTDGGTSGEYDVEYTAPGGRTVTVVIDPLFANNSLTPTHVPMPTLDQVLAFVESPDIPNLPS